MKNCEKCGYCYPDEKAVCEKCGEKLTEYEGPKKEVEYVISDKEKSRRFCSAIKKLCYYCGAFMLFVCIPISILYGWNNRDFTLIVKLFLIFGLAAVVLFALSCILESLIYIAFGSLYRKDEEEKKQ